MARKMKASGIEWIGEIPEEWITSKVKNIYRLKGENGHPDEEVLSLYRDLGIVIKAERNDNFNRTSENTYNYKYVEVNDLVVNKMKAWQGSIATSNYQGIVSPAYYVFKLTEKGIYPFFIHYLMRSSVYLPEYRRLSGGIRPGQWDLSVDNFKNIMIVLPPFTEQEAIADYLDCKCNLIDGTIEKQKAVIEKLKLYKQSVITEAVTKGLDPNVNMKDSGIEWIGEIPESWKVTKLKYEFLNLDTLRKPISSENRSVGKIGYDYYGASGVIDKIDNYIFDETLILIGEDGANLLLRNLPLIYVAKGKYWVNNHAHVLKPKEHNCLPYMAYQLELVDLTIYLSGSTQPKLTQEKLSIIPVVIPPISDQQAIADYLDTKCTQIDTLIANKQTLIDKLTEYKKSLIYECVTGKREVV